MNSIKFIPRDKNQNDFAKELTKRIRSYFKETKQTTFGGYRMVLKALLVIGIYLAPFILVLTVNMSPWFALLMMVVMGIGEAGIGMGVMHDAAHGSFSRYKWVNNLMANTMLLMGSNLTNWKIQHNVLHHTYPNVHEWDRDIDSKALKLTTHSEQHQKVYRYQHIFGPFLYSLMTIARFIMDPWHLREYKAMGALQMTKVNFKREMTMLIITKLLYLAVFVGLPLIFTPFAWWQILIGFFVMHAVASMIMGSVFQMAHILEDLEEPLPNENGEIHNQYYVHQLETTADFGRRYGLFSWYVGGLNFQVEHHLFPHISHVHYPKLSEIVRKTAQEFNQPYHCEKSAISAFRSHLRRLKQLGSKQ